MYPNLFPCVYMYYIHIQRSLEPLANQGQHRSPMQLNGKNCRHHLKAKTGRKWANGLKIDDSEKNCTPGSAPIPGQYTCILSLYSKIFSETAWPIKAKFDMNHLQEGGNQCVPK